MEEYIRDPLTDQKEYILHLGEKERRILHLYTSQFYQEFNHKLRQNESLTPKERLIVEQIDNIFDNAPPLRETLVVYRGITKEFIVDILTYISTTHDISVAKTFARYDCCLLRITILPGSKPLPLISISAHAGEDEVLLPREGRFIINNINTTVQPHVYDLTYIPPGVIELPSISVESHTPTMSDEETVNRLVLLVNPGEVKLFGVEETVRTLVTALGINASEDVIKQVIARIS